jgi:hypothetical protein
MQAGSDAATLARAIPAYEEAIRADSTMAIAWAQLSGASTTLYFNTTPLRRARAQGLRAAERAIALDSTLWNGYYALALYHLYIPRDIGRAAGRRPPDSGGQG